MTEHEHRRIEPEAYAPAELGILAIAPVTWLWLAASGLAFWLAVIQSVVWLI